ncbi:ribosome silencing factor [Phocaeicola paurosaccharolyticus]|jgi:ribosome-associated protein|uniref:ribosome silencing factor n=1 Tax=Phocaeicola paurosaccharolyticus TaxID=732242 RepID=UPI0004693470|nr:ribosome silencing factor [Phocaeicola paurosaccharolyticus]
MKKKNILVEKIIEGIQEKKGKGIVVADLRDTDNTICSYFIICQGNSPTQVASIADSVKDYVREQIAEKPIAVSGIENSEWIAMDYCEAIVHIFLPYTREFYNLEHLWADAKLTNIPDLD